ncbi:endonuclease domain-containing 1 protein-like [Clarias gariepinus]|uniref:endonuclease domain-containing 1 protein-like n=1 Tax=Clarias gariepinus TaxID=13013 RepID=UPI00234C3FDA|nr:endonuclease domain-containing 1 protein-like [Clarias gariepinus]
MKLLAVVLLLLPLSGCLAEVVPDFTVNCSQFFVNPFGIVSPPTTFIDENHDRYKLICQTLNNKIEFATYYDMKNKIPVYSAYRFEGLGNCDVQNSWFIEPQLDSPMRGGKNMGHEAGVRNCGANQALNSDYDDVKENDVNKYDRGHLAPVYCAKTQSCANATFTLTNAAPQNPRFTRGWWRTTERNLANFLNTHCIKAGLRAYVVTGVVPGNTDMNGRVRVPSHYWTAFCCLDNRNNHRHSGGYVGENIEQGKEPQRIKRRDLEMRLRNLYRTVFTLFGGGC